MEEGKGAFKSLTVNLKKIFSGRPRRRWEDNISKGLKRYVSILGIR
jgi:hypothetical protein